MKTEDKDRVLNYEGLYIFLEELKKYFIANPDERGVGRYLRCVNAIDGTVEWAEFPALLTFKGTVSSYSQLPTTSNSPGDVWKVESTGAEYVWILNSAGTSYIWEYMGELVSLTTHAGITDTATAGQVLVSKSNGAGGITYEWVNLPVYTGGLNINIDLNNEISALGYIFDSTATSIATGYNTSAIGVYSHAEGEDTTAKGNRTHVEGNATTAVGVNAHAEGEGEKIYITCQTAEAGSTTYTVTYVNDEYEIVVGDIIGYRGIFGKVISITDSLQTYLSVPYKDITLSRSINPDFQLTSYNSPYVCGGIAFSRNSHSEGYYTKALGYGSHTEGFRTVANNDGEHALGLYNISNQNTIHSIGIGTSENTRKNAVEIMNTGNAYLYGVGGYDGTNQDTADTLQDSLGDKNVLSDWNQSDNTADDFIKNKPTIPTNTDRYVNQATFADDSTSTPNSPVKMTLTRAGSDTATVIANLPKVSSSSAGVVPKGNTVSTLSSTTKFLREDGSWATPSYNNYTLPTASSSTKGGIKVGDGLRIDGSDKLHVDTTVSTATISSNSTTISYDSGKYIKASVQNGDTLTINVNLLSAFSGTPYAKDVTVRITNTSSSTSSAATIKVASTGTTGTLVNMFDTRLTNNTGVSLYGSGTMELVFTFWDKNDVTFNGGIK